MRSSLELLLLVIECLAILVRIAAQATMHLGGGCRSDSSASAGSGSDSDMTCIIRALTIPDQPGCSACATSASKCASADRKARSCAGPLHAPSKVQELASIGGAAVRVVRNVVNERLQASGIAESGPASRGRRAKRRRNASLPCRRSNRSCRHTRTRVRRPCSPRRQVPADRYR